MRMMIIKIIKMIKIIIIIVIQLQNCKWIKQKGKKILFRY